MYYSRLINISATFLASLLLLWPALSFSASDSETCAAQMTLEEKSQRIFNVNMSGMAVITAWGITQWGYFDSSPHATSEGWFANETDNGGADKLGHFYTAYLASHGLAYLYKSWCFSAEKAALYGSLSSFALLGYMELGDSFSDYGFSKEDFWSNTLGSLAGYYLYTNPNISRKLDIRWEYGFAPTGTDFTTDYENAKYLLAVKFNGFEATQSSFLKYFEIHMGYYTRGFHDPSRSKERNLYFAIGINLSDLFTTRGYKKSAAFSKYIQVPATYIER